MLIWGMRTATSLLGSVLAAAGMAASGLAEEGDTGNNSPEVGRIAGAPSGLGRPIRVQRDLVFRQVDGETLKADLYRPDDQTVYPLVLMIHGGAWSAGDKWQLQDHARELAQAGFVALSINYRLAPKHQLTAQVDDCRWALKWAAEQASTWQADPSRLSLWGYSAGGHLAALIATAPAPEAPPVRAVVAGGAPCEFSFLPPHSRALAHVLGGTRQAIPHAYEQAAPLNHVSPDDCPFYFFHGSSDLLVPPSSSQKMHAKLRELNVETQYYTVDGRGHLLTFLDPEARRQAIAFLRQHSSEAP